MQKEGSLMSTAMEIITSRQNQSVSFVCKLSNKKYRDAEGKFRIDGTKLFKEAVWSKVELESVFVRQSALDKIMPIVEKSLSDLRCVKVVSDGVFEKMSEEKSPDGIICVAKYIDNLHKIIKINNREDLITCLPDLFTKKIFALESVRDPGNIGTVIRTAAAFGVECLLISNDCADIYNPRTVRAAMGALFRQRIIRVNSIPNAIEVLRSEGKKVYAAVLGENSRLLGRDTPGETDCIVVGNEGHGLSDETVAACDGSILIPMMPDAESLNAAVASSICMWDQFGRTDVR